MREGYGETFHALIGKTVTAVHLTEDRTALTFTTDSGDVEYVTDGDCCSHSWVEHLSDEKAVIGSPVVSVTEYKDGETLESAHARDCEGKDEPRRPEGNWGTGRCYCECIRSYGWRIQTATGGLDIEVRNSSNGFYGGSMALAIS